MINSIKNSIAVLSLSILTFFIYINFIDPIAFNDVKPAIANNYMFLVYILVISFVSDYLYNSSIANETKRLKESLSVFRYISVFIRIFTLIVALNSLVLDNFFGYEFHDSSMAIYFGISLSAIAMSLFISAKISLGSNYSDCYNQKKPKRIVETGLYSVIRHPLYSSNILLVLSVLIISGSYLIFFSLILLTLFYSISAFKEERYLVNKFPKYSNYSQKTGMFIPKYWK